MHSLKKFNSLIGSLIYSTPTPSSISYWWNFGSLLGICLLIQLISGFFLALHYNSSLEESFSSVVKMMEEVNGGWVIRNIHANGASFFFIFIYAHIGRGLYYGSYKNMSTWICGVLILFILMGTAFLGYVLPWGQMSLWGATVITNLLSALPYVGSTMVEWIWGGFSVSQPTLERFFSIHFLLPFVLSVFVCFHIILLHEKGSSNPLGVDYQSDKVFFHPYFWVKDLMGILFFLFFFFFVSILWGDVFMDPDNFIFANPLSTPPHIQPEWYFLFAYAILRSVPNKLGGVVALVFSIAFLFLLPLSQSKSVNLSIFKKFFFWVLVGCFITLTWVGSMPVEPPLQSVGVMSSLIYFLCLTVMIIM